MRAAAKEQSGEAKADSRARAEARIRELRESMPDGGENRDKYWAPQPPDGWDYQFKRRTVYNQEDPAYQVELARNGWEPVPLSRHPEMMPKGWTGNTIEVEGLVLMERPMVFTQEARRREQLTAREAVLAKEAQLKSSREGDLGERQVHRFKKSLAPIPIPEDA